MVNVILKQNVKKKDMRQITIKVQRTYSKEAEVTIELPDDIVLADVDDYLLMSQGLYENRIQYAMDKQEHSFDDETIRYDVTEVRHIWGGTL
jgi:hypothetical protein